MKSNKEKKFIFNLVQFKFPSSPDHFGSKNLLIETQGRGELSLILQRALQSLQFSTSMD